MRYLNDLTANVEAYMKETLLEKIMKANEGLALCNTAQEIKEYLCDNSTVNTSDFVLRRYIYKYHRELFPQIVDYEELSKDFYVGWSEEVLKHIAKRLSQISNKTQGLKLSTQTWYNYLTGQKVKMRTRVFQIAFVLQMDVENTLELLLAYDMEPYSVRNPIEFICIFCQKNPYKYTWSDVEKVLKCFEDAAVEKEYIKQDLTEGMTQVMQSELDKIFRSDLPDEDTKQMLIQYMVNNVQEFNGFMKKQKRVYLPGYSLKRMSNFMKLTNYLAVLYPTYYTQIEDAIVNPQKGNSNATDNKASLESINKDNSKFHSDLLKVRRDSAGYPKLNDLKEAMFQSQDWNFEFWEIPQKETGVKDFQTYVYYSFCNTYSNHLWAIERLKEGGDNVEFFERKDALLFSYFLINGYINLLNENDGSKNRDIESLLESEDEFDKSLGIIFEELECMEQNEPLERYDTIWKCINKILKEMDYPVLYAPSAFDRFIVLSLMSVSPDELTPLILNQANLDDAMSDME